MVAGSIDHRPDPFGFTDSLWGKFGSGTIYLYTLLVINS